jgi:squalene-hopene/tetraprenyl-beta-curcumene cyclase
MALCAFDDPNRPSLERAVDYLIETQNADGSWTEHEITGTGFPRVFYLKYDMYRNSWPLLALANYRNLLSQPSKSSKPGHKNGFKHNLPEELNVAEAR